MRISDAVQIVECDMCAKHSVCWRAHDSRTADILFLEKYVYSNKCVHKPFAQFATRVGKK